MQDTKENRTRFASLMGEMGIAMRAEVNKEMIQVYWKRLHDRSMYQVKSAINQIIDTGDRFPVVSKIRELASTYREFKTVEKPVQMLEQFSSADDLPTNGDEFFKRVFDFTSEGVKRVNDVLKPGKTGQVTP